MSGFKYLGYKAKMNEKVEYKEGALATTTSIMY